MAKKTLSLIAFVSLFALVWACNSEAPPTNAPATNAANANKPATPANSNAANSNTATLVDMPADVATLFGAKCAGCHGKDAKGGPNAPNIFTVKDKHSSDEWQAYLKNTKIWDKTNHMPIVTLTDDERKKLGDWLATAAGKDAGAAAPAATNTNAAAKNDNKAAKPSGKPGV